MRMNRSREAEAESAATPIPYASSAFLIDPPNAGDCVGGACLFLQGPSKDGSRQALAISLQGDFYTYIRIP
jgi:hypothetical protein